MGYIYNNSYGGAYFVEHFRKRHRLAVIHIHYSRFEDVVPLLVLFRLAQDLGFRV